MVDLPVPLPPTRPVRSRGVISQSQSSNRSLWPKRFPAPWSWIIAEVRAYNNFTVIRSRDTRTTLLSDVAAEVRMLIAKKLERLRDVGFHVAALDDRVEESMLQQKFAALEALRQLLADGLLDDARAREADECAGLGDVQVAQHGETCGDSAGGRIGQHADVRNLR